MPDTSATPATRDTPDGANDAERGSQPARRSADDLQPGDVQLTNTELVQLRIRVIALENLVIALLADTSDQQRARARDMATFISPRPGFTEHPLTIHAAAQMVHLVERADHFRDAPPT